MNNMSVRCEVCCENVPKYKCPACHIQTCCLECVRTHKKQKNCSGARDKTAYVPMKDYTDLNLLSDYRLLEDVSRKTDSAERDALAKKKNPRYRVNLLLSQCSRRKIKLRVMPYPMSKRKNNTSFYHKGSKTIKWFVEWIFPKVDSKIGQEVLGTETLGQALDKFIHPTESDPIKRQLLRPYVKCGVDKLKLVMKMEEQPANDPRFYILDPTKSLDENLTGKVVIEYPTINVLFLEDCKKYRFAGQDKSTEEESESSSSDSSSDSTESDTEDSDPGISVAECGDPRNLDTNSAGENNKLEGDPTDGKCAIETASLEDGTKEKTCTVEELMPCDTV